ncbi:MAG: hypothetical protein AAFV88_15695 [Planctomycetota bacterium]
MSRLEKQLAQHSGEKLIRIDWPSDEVVDAPAIRKQLVKEIDSHTHRIPLDLRGVRGAPPELVEILVDMRRYAMSQSKILSTTWILPPLRDAIQKRLHQPIGSTVKPSAKPENEAASDLAEKLLRNAKEQEKQEYDLKSAEKLNRPKKIKKTLTKRQRYVRLAAAVLGGTLVVLLVGSLIIFTQQDASIIVPEKGFESP